MTLRVNSITEIVSFFPLSLNLVLLTDKRANVNAEYHMWPPSVMFETTQKQKNTKTWKQSDVDVRPQIVDQKNK